MKDSILIVDDNPDILTVLKANLQLHGFEVITASTCQEAGERLNEKLPDLVVLDRILPDGDGVELCSQWSASNRRLPIIMLTARDSISDRVLGLESGADDYVVKPFEPLELVARIKACLRRLRPDESAKLTAGDLIVDRKTMTATLRGESIELTPKEFQLLCLFMERPREVVSRDDIKKALWKDSTIYSWSRVIDVHIQHLRQKIENDPSSPKHIKTVIGMGYKFETD